MQKQEILLELLYQRDQEILSLKRQLALQESVSSFSRSFRLSLFLTWSFRKYQSLKQTMKYWPHRIQNSKWPWQRKIWLGPKSPRRGRWRSWSSRGEREVSLRLVRCWLRSWRSNRWSISRSRWVLMRMLLWHRGLLSCSQVAMNRIGSRLWGSKESQRCRSRKRKSNQICQSSCLIRRQRQYNSQLWRGLRKALKNQFMKNTRSTHRHRPSTESTKVNIIRISLAPSLKPTKPWSTKTSPGAQARSLMSTTTYRSFSSSSGSRCKRPWASTDRTIQSTIFNSLHSEWGLLTGSRWRSSSRSWSWITSSKCRLT